MNKKYDLAVIGGGPAGMMCALTAGKRGLSVVLLEPNYKLGRKLRITGKGRCNVTNNCPVKTVIENIPGDGRFLYSALSRFTPEDVMNFFEENGLQLKTERGNRVFPVSDNANDVGNLLEKLLKETGVEIIHEKAIALIAEDGKVTGVKTEGESVKAQSVAVCTGGLSYPLTGSTGDGYRFAKTYGHSVINPRASLVPLESPDAYCAEMQGLSLKNVTLTLFEDNKKVYSQLGEMLFTHFGVSGPLVLSASAHIRNLGKAEYRLELDLKPGLDEKKLDARILRDLQKFANREMKNALGDLLLSSMVLPVLQISEIPPETNVNSLTREQRLRLLHTLKAFPIRVDGFRPIDEAIITAGGVNTTEVNPRTMESRLLQGLYFAGEILNLDAYTGGFNLQIAWSTGHLAGNSVPERNECDE